MKMRFAAFAAAMLLQAPAGAADQAEIMAHYLDMRAFTQSVQSGYVAGQCAEKLPANAEEIRATLRQWQTENGAAVERGRVAAERLMPELNEPHVLAETRKAFDPQLAADAPKICKYVVNNLRYGVPLAFSGKTLTDRNLRHDIWKQLYPASVSLMSCQDLDSIQTDVTSETGTGQQRKIVERWVVSGCGKSREATISHQPAEGGGTTFVVGFENVPGR